MKLSTAELRNAFTKAPVMAHFDPAKPVYLETDALGFAIAGFIAQQQNECSSGTESIAHSANGNKTASKGHWHPVAF
jgi:hypothetical protein